MPSINTTLSVLQRIELYERIAKHYEKRAMEAGEDYEGRRYWLEQAAKHRELAQMLRSG